MLDGYRVVVSKIMAGVRTAVCQGDTFYVSPAMWDMIRSAEGDELRRLLEAIPVLHLPEAPSPWNLLMED